MSQVHHVKEYACACFELFGPVSDFMLLYEYSKQMIQHFP